MKNIKYTIIPFFLIVLTFASCKKSFLETSPTDRADDATVFKNTDNAMAALNGIHRMLYKQFNLDSQDQGGESGVKIMLDMLGEDVVMTASGNGWYNGIYKWSDHRNASSSSDKYLYKFYYTIIANANNLIERVNGVEGEQITKDAIMAEALTYRAWAHFMLVQVYAKRYDPAGNNTQAGVPIILATNVTARPRSSVEEVYTQINKDIDAAVVLFGKTKARTNKSHFNLNVAQGIKARVALTQGLWTVAATNAKVARADYKLMDSVTYRKGFNDAENSEWIWASKQVEDQTSDFSSFFAYMSGNYGSSNIRANPKAINSLLYATLSATDVRKLLWDPTGKNTDFPIPANGARKPYMNRKFLVAGSTSIGDVTHMRASEMYLIEAEALARSGQTGLAQAALFTLAHSRDSQYVLSTKTGEELIKEILLQRRAELWGEGFRFTDLKRLNSALDRTNSNHTSELALTLSQAPGDLKWQWVIPQDEINANPAIGTGGQNP
ncbi:RagB/SusD family nutrient uptake outer membrane protein [Pedobacter cryoconitis]|uniref:SusD-like starch-binding protein associating with outer membrane n=1 Tax=Pedobacter cryoconitis TaxID=188932 RepID=A0A327SXU8_9SPHI|nr:RagB/SusD family nutrient uptake outer membrane protein [Pedobacter cryoconitis]RAJ34196.1 SusD-like starch-binding protein associating with outer membrane [Pedobacter cryoconitis]